MAVLIVCPDRDPSKWVENFENKDDAPEYFVYPEEHDKSKVKMAITWNHPEGLFMEYPNLEVISSMGAGVDHIMNDSKLPENIRVTRVTDEMLSKDMSDFVLSQVFATIRDLHYYSKTQKEKNWDRRDYLRPTEINVGIMGLGELGSTAAKKLVKNDFNVLGWSSSEKNIDGVQSFSGDDGLKKFISKTNILICLLPLTDETEGILNRQLFQNLPKNAYVINVARGEHLVEADLTQMLDNGHLSGASLDVFRTEPLPEDHSFWDHEKINITPHIASVTNPKSALSLILENYRRMENKEDLINEVDMKKGY